MSVRTLALAGVAALAFTISAHAAPIAAGSSLDTTGSTSIIGGNGDASTATGLNFLSVFTSSQATAATGTFAGLFSTRLSGIANSIPTFSPFTAVNNFFAFTENNRTLSFDLTSITSLVRTPSSSGAGGSLAFTGNGFFNLTGFDRTPGSITLSTQGNGTTTYSASTTAAAAVPEPASLALLGLGVAGLAALRRRAV